MYLRHQHRRYTICSTFVYQAFGEIGQASKRTSKQTYREPTYA